MEPSDPNVAIIAQYTEDTNAALLVTNSYLAVQHEILLALVAAVIILLVALLFVQRGRA